MRRTRLSKSTVLRLLAPLTLAACTAHVTSSVKINGVPFQPTTCVSGQSHGFPGVELADPQGNRLRMGTNFDGTTAVAYFTPASPVGDVLGTCANLSVQQGTGVINGVRNLEGSASLSCRTERNQIEGAVLFENCH